MGQESKRNVQYDWLESITDLTPQQREKIYAGINLERQTIVGNLIFGYEPTVDEKFEEHSPFAQRFLQLIYDQSQDTFSDRPQVIQAIEDIKNRPFHFLRLVHQFNYLTESAKSLVPKLAINPKYQNSVMVYESGALRSLPKFNHLFSFNLIIDERESENAMQKINTQMENGESIHQSPFLDFHLRTIDTEALLIGGLFAMYSEQMVSRYGWDMFVSRSQLNGALIEVASQHPRSAIWNALSDPEKLNYRLGEEQYHPEFIKPFNTKL